MSTRAELNAARFCGSILDQYVDAAASDEHFFARHAFNVLGSLLSVLEDGVACGYFDDEIAHKWYAWFLSSEVGRRSDGYPLLHLKWMQSATPPVDAETGLMLIEAICSSDMGFVLAAMLDYANDEMWEALVGVGTWTLRVWLERSSVDFVKGPLDDIFLSGIFVQESMRTLVGDAVLDNRFDQFCVVVDHIVRQRTYLGARRVIEDDLSEQLRYNGIEVDAVRSAVATLLWADSWDTVRIGTRTSYKAHDKPDASRPLSLEARAITDWAFGVIKGDEAGLEKIVGGFVWRAVQLASQVLDAGSPNRRAFLMSLGESVLTQTDQTNDYMQGNVQAYPPSASELARIRQQISKTRQPRSQSTGA